jgi:hypothetical protein
VSISPNTHLEESLLGAALENFPARKRKKSFGSTYAKKIEAKKTSEAQFVPPPKSAISTFDDGGQYPPKVIISQY